MYREKSTGALQRTICMFQVLLTALFLTLPAKAADTPLYMTEDGLYRTDDGKYGVYVLSDNPQAVGIARYLPASAPKNLTVPGFVTVGGVRLPVHEISYSPYAGHTEIETVRFEPQIERIAGTPFDGCSGLQKIHFPNFESSASIGATAYVYFEQFIEAEWELQPPPEGIISEWPDGGMVSEYVDVKCTPEILHGPGEFTVTLTLRDGVEALAGTVACNMPNVELVDVGPGEATDELSFAYWLFLGKDEETGKDYGRTCTLRYRADESTGQNICIALAHFVQRTAEPDGSKSETRTGTVDYIIPYNPDISPLQDVLPTSYPPVLPIPADVEPIQEETFKAVNAVRSSVGSPQLKHNMTLDDAAMIRATEMALAENLSHTRPDGSANDTVVTGATGPLFGENIAEPGWCRQEDASDIAVQMWEDDAPHYEILIHEGFTAMGSGYARSKSGRWYACLILGAPPARPTFVTFSGVKIVGRYEPDAVVVPDSQPLPNAPAVPVIEQTQSGPILTGLSAGAPQRIRQVLDLLELSEPATFVDAAGNTIASDAFAATGQEIRLSSQDEPVAIVVVKGDVCGSGEMSLSQIVTLAQAVSGQKTLQGAYLAAGDLNDSGSVDLSDLVLAAKMLA